MLALNLHRTDATRLVFWPMLQALEAATAAHAEELAGVRASHEEQVEALQRGALAQLTEMRHMHEHEVQLMMTEHAEALRQAQVRM